MADNFESDFMFALHVFRALGCDNSDDELETVLRKILSDEITLSESPPDAITSVDAQLGEPLSEAHRKFAESYSSGAGREQSIRWHKESARTVLKMMGRNR